HLLKPGTTEMEFRRALIDAFFKFGGGGEAFPTIVASGRNSAVPHWETGNREIKDGDIVIVDFGTVYSGYVSDITRTFLIGNVSSEARKIYDAVLEAQKLGIEELRAGKSCAEVDLKVRKFLEKKGYGEFFTHSLGHGIGVEVHEAPTLSKRSTEILKEGNVVTVEPGVYIPEIGGVRIEDDCLITENGTFVISNLNK
ncbi:MAG: M24 family metallopeptidase, partial [Desulfurobacteriaceae bacterium]